MEKRKKYFYINDEEEKKYLKIISSSEIAKKKFTPKGEYDLKLGKKIEEEVLECLYSKDIERILSLREDLKC